MRTTTWVAAYNHPTRSWSTGGPLSEYDHQHWDLFLVPARSREEAQAAARALRRKQAILTEAQVRLLASLLDTHAEDGGSVAAECPWVEVSGDETRTAKALAAKGLVALHDPSARHVKLTVCAFNKLPAVEACRKSNESTK